MATLSPQTIDSAPAAARPGLEAVRRQLGFIPNLFATFAESPTLLAGYLALDAAYTKGTLTPLERQAVLIAVSAENECEYCVAAHSTIATMLRVPGQVLSSVRDGSEVDDARIDALVRLTRTIVRTRGNVPDGTIEGFLASGFTKDQLGEVLVGVGLKTISNYFNALAGTPLDDAFKPQAWRTGVA
jgi:AhpD family alkylhydroperoxidase